ncbi:hypothetical protein GmHk_19G054701 [Glycine max]|nr:hypothetical protein GmHk_19G054701 [Glycine max]
MALKSAHQVEKYCFRGPYSNPLQPLYIEIRILVQSWSGWWNISHFHLNNRALLRLGRSLIPNPPICLGEQHCLQEIQAIFLLSGFPPHRNSLEFNLLLQHPNSLSHTQHRDFLQVVIPASRTQRPASCVVQSKRTFPLVELPTPSHPSSLQQDL